MRNVTVLPQRVPEYVRDPHVRERVEKRQCGVCKHAGSDPDGGFCAHPTSVDATKGFCWSWNTARHDGRPCGPTGALFEPMPQVRMIALGLLEGRHD